METRSRKLQSNLAASRSKRKTPEGTSPPQSSEAKNMNYSSIRLNVDSPNPLAPSRRRNLPRQKNILVSMDSSSSSLPAAAARSPNQSERTSNSIQNPNPVADSVPSQSSIRTVDSDGMSVADGYYDDDYSDDYYEEEDYHPAWGEERLAEAGFGAYEGFHAVSAPSGSRFKSILASLRDGSNVMGQINALSELCNVLSMATERSLDAFSMDSFVPVLVELLNSEGLPETMLLSARALTHLCDIVPHACSVVVRYGAVQAFCARLLNIEYIDLAEQSLQALEKLSHRHAHACLHGGVLMAVLQYIDFFSSGAKRVALATAANICKQLSSDTIHFAIDTVPTLTGFLGNEDLKVVENASKCLCRIVESCVSSLGNLNKISTSGLLSHAVNLISLNNAGGPQASFGSSTYTVLIKLLSTCASNSAVSTKELLQMGISTILRDTLSGSGLSIERPPDQMYDVVAFANKLLPLFAQKTTLICHPYVGSSRSLRKQASRQAKEIRENINKPAAEVTEHEKVLRENPQLLLKFGVDLLPVLIQFCGASVSVRLRHEAMAVIKKLLWFCGFDTLKSLLQSTNIASFLAGILNGKDAEDLLSGMEMAEILMQKAPDLSRKSLIKEGVFYAISNLINSGVTKNRESNMLRNKKRSSGDTGIIASEIDDSVSLVEMVVPANSTMSNISLYAKCFKDAYFAVDSGFDNECTTESFCNLKNICNKVNDALYDAKLKMKGKAKKYLPETVDNDLLNNLVSDILSELMKHDCVSAFEFVRSGIVECLLNYFQGGDIAKRLYEKNKSEYYEVLLRRLQSFIQISIPVNSKGDASPLCALVRKLQDALSSSEHFEIVSSHASFHSDNNAYPKVLDTLAKPIKLRLHKAAGESNLLDYPSPILCMRLSDSVADLENLVWPKVEQGETIAGQRVGTGSIGKSLHMSDTKGHVRSHSSNASTEKGKMVVNADNKAHVTRSAARKNMISKRYTPKEIENVESGMKVEDFSSAPIVMMDGAYSPVDRPGVYSGGIFGMGDYVDYMADLLPQGDLNATAISNLRTSNMMANAGLHQGISFNRIDLTSPENNVISMNKESTNCTPRLNFFLGEKQLERTSSLYKAILQSVADRNERKPTRSGYPTHESQYVFDKIYTITYRKAESSTTANLMKKCRSSALLTTENLSFFDIIAQRKLPCVLKKKDSTYDILLLLKILEGLNRLAPFLRAQALSSSFANGEIENLEQLKPNGTYVSQDEFLSNKLTPKLMQQMQDVMALCTKSIPAWCQELPKACPFLFPFDIRRKYFIATSLGSNNSVYNLVRQVSGGNPYALNNHVRNFGRLDRKKVLVSRENILDSAATAMDSHSIKNTLLEFEYVGEVGTGLGPTLEFYTLLSHEFQKTLHGMWRNNSCNNAISSDLVMVDAEDATKDVSLLQLVEKNKQQTTHMDNSVDYVEASLGLFPRPYLTNGPNSLDFNKVKDKFSLLGRVMAKALQDERLLDLPLSRAFYKLILGQELNLFDINSFDPQLGTTLQELDALVRRKKLLNLTPSNDGSLTTNLEYHGAKIEDLCINFMLPGFSDFPLKPGGEDIYVNLANMEEYVNLVVDATINTGVMPQIEAFKKGFNEVFPLSSLQIFFETELDCLFCGVQHLWRAETLSEHMKFDHGYTVGSPHITNLLEIMGEFNPLQQRAFMQFVTGSPRLPPGGLAALSPKLTVVCKLHPGGHGVLDSITIDEVFPSAMTCANYLKLPPYSTKEIMRKRLLYAISEGQGSFDLS